MSNHTARVHAFLEQALAAGGYAAGAKLPTERDLSERIGVPRSAVRDALSVLEARGVVTRRVGSGTYVAETAAPAPSGRPSEVSPAEIMAARLVVEPRLALLIVTHATASDFEAMDACNRKAEAAADFETFERYDAALHQVMAEATHNRLIVDLYREVTEARDRTEWGDLKRRSINAARRATYQGDHRRIVAALRARDAVAAERAIEEHLKTVRSNLLEG
ncbi:FadR/GntR family transcriptional regulator [Aquabacter spiritensis]|uniref:GntR family transcriptional regulator n=1 Tax=Aquabacter spiritensis TaxID=933073 RepID=A0A4R3LTE0_9HYPH|nr:FCD domain-containing protein [Aquabacter spiritensis]TCT03844.1 GntR family transcriptional regulator [Aquabacter spiritensis]